MSKRQKVVPDFHFPSGRDVISLICSAVHHVPGISIAERIETLISLRSLNRRWKNVASKDPVWLPVLDELNIDLGRKIKRSVFKEVVQRTFWGRNDLSVFKVMYPSYYYIKNWTPDEKELMYEISAYRNRILGLKVKSFVFF